MVVKERIGHQPGRYLWSRAAQVEVVANAWNANRLTQRAKRRIAEYLTLIGPVDVALPNHRRYQGNREKRGSGGCGESVTSFASSAGREHRGRLLW